MTKDQLAKQISEQLTDKGFRILQADFTRPWGGFFVIDEQQADLFIDMYFPGYKKEDLLIGNKLSPKILVVAPGQRLSWQYHHRRAEIWKVIDGEVAVVRSPDNTLTQEERFRAGELIVLDQGMRHRLIGLSAWGVLAEIWRHTDPLNPSDEEDIVRVQDDYGR